MHNEFQRRNFYIGDIILSNNFEHDLETLKNYDTITFLGCEKQDTEHWKVNFMFSQNLIYNLSLLKIYTTGLLASGSGSTVSYILKKGDTLRFSKNFKYKYEENYKTNYCNIKYIKFEQFYNDKITLTIEKENYTYDVNENSVDFSNCNVEYDITKEELEELRKADGCNDIVCFAEDLDTMWLCVCGNIVSREDNRCNVCNRYADHVLNNYTRETFKK